MLSGPQQIRLEARLKELLASYEWRSIRQFFTAEASEDVPDLPRLKQFVIDKLDGMLTDECEQAKARTGR